MSNLKELMTNGVFGTTNGGCNFVIVNDYMVYQDGDFDDVSQMTESTMGHRVVKLVKDIKSFHQLEHGAGTIIYKEADDNKATETEKQLDELHKLLDDIKKEARSKGLTDNQANSLIDGLVMAATAAAVKDVIDRADR